MNKQAYERLVRLAMDKRAGFMDGFKNGFNAGAGQNAGGISNFMGAAASMIPGVRQIKQLYDAKNAIQQGNPYITRGLLTAAAPPVAAAIYGVKDLRSMGNNIKTGWQGAKAWFYNK